MVPPRVLERTVIFVNSPLNAEQLAAQTSIPGRLTTLDLTEIALQQLGGEYVQMVNYPIDPQLN